MTLDREKRLRTELSGILARHRFTHDPAPVIAELRQAAGDRTDILGSEVGHWAGFYDSPDTHTLVEALLQIEGAADTYSAGVQRSHAAKPGA